MKRFLCMLLAIFIFLTFLGCGSVRSDPTVNFCYLRREITSGTADGVLVMEERSLSGRSDDLASLLEWYLQGPVDDDLVLPLPQGTRLLEYGNENGILTVTFSTHLAQLQDMDLTVACACIASTCFQLTDAQQIQIKTSDTSAGTGISISMSRNSLLTFDEIQEVSDK